MDREGIKSIATMRQGKGIMLKPPPAVGQLPGGPLPQATGAHESQQQTRTSAATRGNHHTNHTRHATSFSATTAATNDVDDDRMQQ